MEWADFSGVLTKGGTILGTSRTPFKMLDAPEADGVEKVPAMVANYRKIKLDCLFMLGGNGSTKTANRLRQEGLNVIALPKTIDNDTWGTDMTFGFTSAVEVATKCIDDIHTTASSHGRVFVIEIMGHKVGWIPLYAGIAGGADIILIPEIPYDLKAVERSIEQRIENGGRFAIVVVAEGAISKEDAALSKKEYKKKLATRTSPPSRTTSLQTSSASPGAKRASPFPAIPNAAANPMPKTAFLPPSAASRPPAAVSRVNLASWWHSTMGKCAEPLLKKSPVS